MHKLGIEGHFSALAFKAWVAGEPEFQGNVQGLARQGDGSTAGVLVGGGQAGGVADHVGITQLVTSGLG